ncbi:helix-turn-helix domain-containing protein [Geobacter sp. AOG1]|uniref:helix-turn-helix domain-containing protein n=1 Tax=Geobacter sp. AOG1 TaxID=1566346 RepID=UPI001CC81DFA|nr:helix-turn-helix domain-containing protein [Geobacter sp. AOG1]
MSKSNPLSSADVLTVEQFAERLQVSRTTVFAWLKSGAILEGVHYFRLGRILRFRWQDDLFFNNRPMLNTVDAAASPLPLVDDPAQDSQRGEATVNNPPLPLARSAAPVINLDY